MLKIAMMKVRMVDLCMWVYQKGERREVLLRALVLDQPVREQLVDGSKQGINDDDKSMIGFEAMVYVE